MKKYEIVFITRTLGIGGVAKSLIDVIKCLDNNKFNITIGVQFDDLEYLSFMPNYVNITCYGKTTSRLFKKMISFRDININNKHLLIFTKAINQVEKFYYFSKCKYFLKTHPCDFAIAYHQGFASTMTVKYARCDKKILWYHSSTDMPDCKENIFTKADLIICCTPSLCYTLFKNWSIDRNKIIAIPCILNADEIIRLSKIRISFSLSIKNATVFITVSRLVESKGLLDGFKIFSDIYKQNKSFCWIVVGSGPLENTLKEMVKANNMSDNIFVLGEKINPYPYFKISDFYFSPSLYECYGITLGESRVLGLPIITLPTNAGCYHVKNGFNGIITEDLKASVLKIMDNKALKNRLIINAKKDYFIDENENNKNILNLQLLNLINKGKA